MKKICVILIGCFAAAACRKGSNSETPPPQQPEMIYTDLKNMEMMKGQPRLVDVNKDNDPDFWFNTLLVGDPILRRDRLLFLAWSRVGTYVLAGPLNNTMALDKDAVITSAPPQGYDWFEVQDVLLAEKITPETGPVFWQGNWKSAVNKYLPLQIRSGGLVYNGWVELTMDTVSERLIMHRTAISKKPGVPVKAGN